MLGFHRSTLYMLSIKRLFEQINSYSSERTRETTAYCKILCFIDYTAITIFIVSSFPAHHFFTNMDSYCYYWVIFFVLNVWPNQIHWDKDSWTFPSEAQINSESVRNIRAGRCLYAPILQRSLLLIKKVGAHNLMVLPGSECIPPEPLNPVTRLVQPISQTKQR